MSEIINLKNKIDDILKKKIKEFQLKNIVIDIVKNNKNEREKENIEIICKKDFLKELEIIVNAYKDIYNDIEIEEMFENFKESF